MKDHIITDHRFNRCLLINLCAGFPCIVMPIAIQITDPIENIFGENLTVLCKYISKCHKKKTAPILLGGLFFCPLKKYISKDRNGVWHYGGLFKFIAFYLLLHVQRQILQHLLPHMRFQSECLLQ